ncbi:MAG: rhodanese-like domain-containing protein, partial [Planctomycetota bacterium]
MTTLSTDELHKQLESGEAAVFDVRGDLEFELGHIPFVAVYSAGGDCRLATEAARRLENLGLRNVHRYEDGLEGWRAARLPVVP